MQHQGVLVLAAFLFALSAYVLTYFQLTPEDILLPSKALLEQGVFVFMAFALMGAALVILSVIENKQFRYIAWGTGLVVGIALLLLLSKNVLTLSFFTAAMLGLGVYVRAERGGVSALWHALGGMRGIGAAIVFVLLFVTLNANAAEYQHKLEQTFVQLALAQAGSSTSIREYIANAIPDEITPEERAELLKALKQAYPNWDELPVSERQKIEESYFNQFLQLKKGIKQALLQSFSGIELNTLSEKMLESMKSVPLVRTVVENATLIYALVGTFLYSVFAFFGSLAAFLVGLPIWTRKQAS